MVGQQKVISSSFNVNTVEDGESAPYYFQEWFAWSNVESTVNVTTSPFGNDTEPNPVWSTSIPENTEGLAYLWSKSIRYVWNESTRQYAAETAQYYRKTGTNGTSISSKGTVDYAYNSSSVFPPPTSSINGKKAIAKGDNRIWKCQGVAQGVYAWTPSGGTASDGFSYTVGEGNFSGSYQSTSNLTGHFVMWSDEADDWVDLGQFKGQNGTTYYTHIAWATAVTLSDTQLPIPTGQTNRPNAITANIEGFAITPATGVDYAWMGYLIDTVSSDSQVKQNYTWEKNKGAKGDNGDDGVSYSFVFTKASAKVDEENTVTAQLAGYAYKYVGGVRTALTNTTIRYGYILTDSDTYTDTTTNSSGFFDAGTWFNGDDITDYGKNSPSIFAAIEIDDVVVHAEMITISVKGETGARGNVGRFFYYGGTFNPQDNDPTHVFVVNDAQAPYFEHSETVTTQSGTTTIKRYHVFNYETNGSYTMAQMWSISNQSWSNTPWEAMTNDFKYLITEALFTDFAKLASAIFTGDWMLSQYGVPTRQVTAEEKELVYFCVNVDGQYPVSDLATLLVNETLWNEYKGYGYSDAELEAVADVCQWAVAAMPTNTDDVRYNAIQTISSTSYQLFGLNPSNLFSVFAPNISLDFLRGKAYLNDCNVKGNLVGRVSNPLTRIKNGSVWGDYGVQASDDYGYTRHYLFINRMPTWNVQIEYMSGEQTPIRRLILPVITYDTLGTEIEVVNVSGDTLTVEGKPESSTYAAEGSYLLDGIQTTGYSNDLRTIVMEDQTILKFVSVEIPTQSGEYGWIAIGEPQTIKSQV